MAYRGISCYCIIFKVIQHGLAITSGDFERSSPRLVRREVGAAREERHTYKSNSSRRQSELVIAVCEEDIGWIENVSNKYDQVYVFDKCQKERKGPLAKFKSTNVVVRNTSNVGSCDSAFLHYILDRWDTLPDIVEFTKGGNKEVGVPPLSCPICDVSPLTCDPKDTITVANAVPDPEHIWENGKPFLKKPSSKMIPLFNFHLGEYKFRNNKHNQVPFKTSGFKNMGEWLDHASPPLNRQLYLDACCVRNYGGHMTATREQIRNEAYFKGKGRALYEFLWSQQHDANEEIDHFIERTWMAAFCAQKYELALRS